MRGWAAAALVSAACAGPSPVLTPGVVAATDLPATDLVVTGLPPTEYLERRGGAVAPRADLDVRIGRARARVVGVASDRLVLRVEGLGPGVYDLEVRGAREHRVPAALRVVPDRDAADTGTDGGAIASDAGPIADAAVSATCGDSVLDAAEECDDGDLADGDGCDRRCRMEGWPTDTCPSPVVFQLRPGRRQLYRGSTVGLADVARCERTARGPDAMFSVETRWTGRMRVRVEPVGGWRVVVSARGACGASSLRPSCADSGSPGSAVERTIGVVDGGRYTVVVSGDQASDAGEFTIAFSED